jgi:hypothetical protein
MCGEHSPPLRLAIPTLVKAENPHILVLSPPLNLVPQWFADHCAYTMSKFGMSMCVLGMSEEFRAKGIAVNALWPRTMIETSASKIIGVDSEGCRTVDIMADAAHVILTRRSRACTGNFFIDDEVLASEGIVDLAQYSAVPNSELAMDLFVLCRRFLRKLWGRGKFTCRLSKTGRGLLALLCRRPRRRKSILMTRQSEKSSNHSFSLRAGILPKPRSSWLDKSAYAPTCKHMRWFNRATVSELAMEMTDEYSRHRQTDDDIPL